MLTEAVRRNPYSVVLLDEAEKAHPDVLELFYQVFDKGVMDDAEGREIDFRHCVIILTSNVGAAQIQQASAGYCSGEAPDADALTKALHHVLAQTFRPALLGRMQVVPYFAVADAALDRIVRLKLDRIAARLVADHQAQLSYDDRFVQAVKVRCTEVDSGARNIDHILDGTVLPTIAGHVLQRMASGEPLRRIHVGADTTGGFAYSVL